MNWNSGILGTQYSIVVQEGWRGYLWQGRFGSYVLDGPYVVAAARYIEMNPVRANLAVDPWDYPWSSAQAHVEGKDNDLVTVAPLLEMVGGWKEFLRGEVSEEEVKKLRQHERTGRPLGKEEFVKNLEQLTGRRLRKKKPGPRKGGAQQ